MFLTEYGSVDVLDDDGTHHQVRPPISLMTVRIRILLAAGWIDADKQQP
jgi:hypothetical protein